MAVQEIILLNQNTPVNIPGGLVPKGAYDAGTTYAVGDSVDYNGSSYVKFASGAVGTLPTVTATWQVLANKGNTGSTGATGANGAAGVVQSVAAGTGISVDATDPANPIITNTGGAGGGHIIEEEGTPLTQRTNLNFVGAGVTATDDAGNDATVVTITSGGGSGDVIAPATNTDSYIPQWNGDNSKTLKNGLAVPAGGLAGLTALGDKVDKVAGSRLITTAEGTILGNTSGTNTGDNIEVTAQATGFTITKGTTPKTLTVALDANVAGTNTGDQDLSGLVTKAGSITQITTRNLSDMTDDATHRLVTDTEKSTWNGKLSSLSGAAILAGLAGGQTLNGGVAQTETLSLIGNAATASGTNIAGGDVNIKAQPGTGTGASSIHFFTGTTLTTGSTLQISSEKMTILGNGNVGIGTTSPASLLNVNGNALIGSATKPFTEDFKLQVKGTTNGFVVQTDLPSGSTTGLAFSIGATGETYVRTNFYSNGYIGFGSGNATRDVFLGRVAANTIGIVGAYDGTGTGNLTITGNVGIGTTSPGTKLQISGTDAQTSGTGVVGVSITPTYNQASGTAATRSSAFPGNDSNCETAF